MAKEELNELTKLKELKAELMSFDNSNNNDQDFKNLLTMKDIDNDLKTSLILLHSNYKAELKELKSYVYKIMYSTVDKTESVLEDISGDISKCKKGGFFSNATRNIAIIFGIIIIVFFLLFIFAVINPDAFNNTANALTKIIGGVFGLDKEVIMSPTGQ